MSKSRSLSLSSSLLSSNTCQEQQDQHQDELNRQQDSDRGQQLNHWKLQFLLFDTQDTTQNWGLLLLLICWIAFAAGIGGIFGLYTFDDVPNSENSSKTKDADPNDELGFAHGYYMCLLILTFGGIFWIWAILNWVGLKYFRHTSSGINNSSTNR